MQIVDEQGRVQFSVLGFFILVLVYNNVDLKSKEKLGSGYQIFYLKNYKIIDGSDRFNIPDVTENSDWQHVSDVRNNLNSPTNSTKTTSSKTISTLSSKNSLLCESKETILRNLLTKGNWMVNINQKPDSNIPFYVWPFKEQISKQITSIRNTSVSWITHPNSPPLSYDLNKCIPNARILVFGDSKSRQMGLALEAVYTQKFDKIVDMGSHGNIFFKESKVEFFWCTDIHRFNSLLTQGTLASKSNNASIDYVITDSMILHVLAGGNNVTANNAVLAWEKSIQSVEIFKDFIIKLFVNQPFHKLSFLYFSTRCTIHATEKI